MGNKAGITILIMIFLLLFSSASFAAINSGCSKAGNYDPMKLPTADLIFDGSYKSPVGYNTTKIFFYYPSGSTLLSNTSSINTPNTVSFSVPFTLTYGKSRFQYNATLVNSTSGASAWECQYVDIIAPEKSSGLIKNLVLVIIGTVLILGFIAIFMFAIKTGELEYSLWGIVSYIIACIVVLAIIISFISILF